MLSPNRWVIISFIAGLLAIVGLIIVVVYKHSKPPASTTPCTDQPPTLKGATADCAHQSTYSAGTKCNYKSATSNVICNPEQSTLVCDGGKWKGDLPVCTEGCAEVPPTIVGMTATCSAPYKDNVKCTYVPQKSQTCRGPNGEVIGSAGITGAVCSSGKWETINLNCADTGSCPPTQPAIPCPQNYTYVCDPDSDTWKCYDKTDLIAYNKLKCIDYVNGDDNTTVNLCFTDDTHNTAISPTTGIACDETSTKSLGTNIDSIIGNPPGNIYGDKSQYYPIDPTKRLYYKNTDSSGNPAGDACILWPNLNYNCENGGMYIQDVPGVSKTGSCKCTPGFVGPQCQFSDAVTCAGHGTANADGTCKCTPGFAGPQCQFSDAVTCAGRGTANADGSCTCTPGITGPHCQFSDAVTCTGHGTANADGSCTCTPGIAGPHCQFSDAVTCTGRGTAKADGSCTCQSPHVGAQCTGTPGDPGYMVEIKCDNTDSGCDASKVCYFDLFPVPGGRPKVIVWTGDSDNNHGVDSATAPNPMFTQGTCVNVADNCPSSGRCVQIVKIDDQISNGPGQQCWNGSGFVQGCYPDLATATTVATNNVTAPVLSW